MPHEVFVCLFVFDRMTLSQYAKHFSLVPLQSFPNCGSLASTSKTQDEHVSTQQESPEWAAPLSWWQINGLVKYRRLLSYYLVILTNGPRFFPYHPSSPLPYSLYFNIQNCHPCPTQQIIHPFSGLCRCCSLLLEFSFRIFIPAKAQSTLWTDFAAPSLVCACTVIFA